MLYGVMGPRALWKRGAVCGGSLDGLCGAVSADRGRRISCGKKARTDLEAREPGEGKTGAPLHTEWRSGAVLGLGEASDSSGRETPNEFSPGRYAVGLSRGARTAATAEISSAGV